MVVFRGSAITITILAVNLFENALRAQETLPGLRPPRHVRRAAGCPGNPIVLSAQRQTLLGSDPTPALMVLSRQGPGQGPPERSRRLPWGEIGQRSERSGRAR